MDPRVLQGGFRVAVLIFVVSLITLPMQDRASAEFVVTAMGLVVGALFIAVIVGLARLATPGIPGDRVPQGDKAEAGRYNSTDHQEGKT